MYRVEKDVAFPSRMSRGKYPFEEMEVGDSFAEKIQDGEDPSSVRGRLYGAARTFGKAEGKKFSSSHIGNTIRIWRTA